MTIETAAAYAALVFFVFSMPSERMLEFSAWRFQKGFGASLALGLSIFVVRAAFFGLALAAAMFFVRAMPDGLALARGAAMVFLALTLLRQALRLRQPFRLADNDNLPGNTFATRFWHGLRSHFRPSFELALAAAMVIFFVSPSAVTVFAAEQLAIAHGAASLLSLLVYAVFSRPVLARLDRRLGTARRARVARLLSSGLPRVSARFRQDAA
ncbi:hypothetical protein [Martelella endophytica]|uniref:Lysine transporter LysE n=1 Tax=Martelella endophytica TaxID=1486262 RepID=A0A0D5LR92_MAREN|nr:hypothetical protein [Martelella endophytica]AJY46440.1 hypothetical protein TM49_13365 [Martelella endophytica]